MDKEEIVNAQLCANEKTKEEIDMELIVNGGGQKRPREQRYNA